jgi:prolyl oligopeptidase
LDQFNILYDSKLLPYLNESVPSKVANGSRLFYWRKNNRAHRTFYSKANSTAAEEVILDPSNWEPDHYFPSAGNSFFHGNEDNFYPSPDGKYVGYCEITGNRQPQIRILNVITKEVLKEEIKGEGQYFSGWLPDSSGFLYTATPQIGEVPEGEEYYWDACYRHILGTPPHQDIKLFYDDKTKEHTHSAFVSSDGKHSIFYRSLNYGKNEVYFEVLGDASNRKALITGFQAIYSVDIFNNNLYIYTNENAPTEWFILQISTNTKDTSGNRCCQNAKMFCKASFFSAITLPLFI